ncbi:hypothetical protein [Fontivita pretiosa]|uniref:hypothetical protein n=1 Tax=Fontivita pretiosa TaxID=2989684 RepID=UPI003D17CC10
MTTLRSASASPSPPATLPPLRLHVASPAEIGPRVEHLQQIAAARQLGRKVRRAVNVARINGWISAIFAAVTLLSASRSVSAMVLGAGMAVISYVEFHGARGLERLDLSAPRRLAANQLALALLLFGYAAMCLWMSLSSPSELLSAEMAQAVAADPQLAGMMAPLQDLVRQIHILVYAILMIIAPAGPALLALYYLSRRRHIQACLQQTPQWIVELQRAGVRV